MAIDYDQAHKRIIMAFLKGMVQTYGLRRMEKRKHRYMKPGRLYWDRNEEWTDPEGKARKGRFKRKPSTLCTQEIEIPQGVVPEEILQYANAMAGAFLETLRIAEEHQLGEALGAVPTVGPVPTVVNLGDKKEEVA